ncbi:MAG: hypothetical protein M1827_006462 [Pycnora praestabilis]|nr:MAG: hypothetical protein M1827_006462 [Pycnora praestabilis]
MGHGRLKKDVKWRQKKLRLRKNIRRACPLAWFSMSAYGFGNGASDAGHSYTIMRLPPRSEHWVEAVDAVQKQVIDADKGKVLDEYMLWELASAFD